MTLPTPDQIASVQRLLPATAASEDGWDQAKILLVLGEHPTVARAVRFYWLERVNESAQYINIGDKNLEQIYKHAKEMLDYWDAVIAVNPEGLDPSEPEPVRVPLTFGQIERPFR